jgi:mycofactocin precursor
VSGSRNKAFQNQFKVTDRGRLRCGDGPGSLKKSKDLSSAKNLAWGRIMEKTELNLRQYGEGKNLDSKDEEPAILKEIEIEEIFIDGICGVY